MTNEEKLLEIRRRAKLVYEIWIKFKSENYVPLDVSEYIENFHELVDTSDDLYEIRYARFRFISIWEVVDKIGFTDSEITEINEFNDLVMNALVQ